MRICSMPQCQTTAGCKCQPPTGVAIPPVTQEDAWKASYELVKAENNRLRAALVPFAVGADQIPANWPEHRALLIDEKHPDNPKSYCLLLARVCDFRAARAAIGHG